MKCKHEWEDIEDGSLDKHCIKCGKKVKQGQLAMPNKAKIQEGISMPVAREKIKVPHYTGGETVIVEVFKDDFLKEFRKSLNLSIISSPGAGD